jgi:hypothetical protein
VIPTGGGSKLKGYLALAVLLFFIASNPSGAASVAIGLGNAFTLIAGGIGDFATALTDKAGT